MGIDIELDRNLCSLAKGPRNLITDVPGVRVGHVTLVSGTTRAMTQSPAGGLHTGVTAVVPPGDCFMSKLPAAAYVSNGFGKSMGLVQIEELGSLETPILLTNTFACGAAFDALVDYSLRSHPQIGVTTSTVNPVVLECNDGPINSIRTHAVTPEDGLTAIEHAGDVFEEGDVGAGSGMTCFDLKGGIGSASRIMRIDGHDYTIGVMVMTNFGSLACLRLHGRPLGAQLAQHLHATSPADDLPVGGGADLGSIVAVIATDIPFDSRQLHRLCKRVTVGIVRCGGYIGDGSGEIAVAFSTANRRRHWTKPEQRNDRRLIDTINRVDEHLMDDSFRAVASASEEAIVSSLLHAHTVIGRTGEPTLSLRDAARKAGITLFDQTDDTVRHTANRKYQRSAQP